MSSGVEEDKLKWTWDPKRGRLVNLTKPALQNKGAPQEGVEGAWRCTGCKNVNFGTRDSCHRCSTPKPPQHILDERIWAIQSGQAPSARWPNGAPKEGIDGNWACSNCGNVNWVMRTTCHRCDADIPPPEVLEKRLEELMAERAEQEQRKAMGIMREQPKEGVKDSWKCAAARSQALARAPGLDLARSPHARPHPHQVPRLPQHQLQAAARLPPVQRAQAPARGARRAQGAGGAAAEGDGAAEAGADRGGEAPPRGAGPNPNPHPIP